MKSKQEVLNDILLEAKEEGEPAKLLGENLEGFDLRNTDLREVDLREANLRNTDLREVDLRDADIREADLTGADLSGSNLVDADFQGAKLINAKLISSNLQNADMRYTNLNRADLFGANVVLCDFENADLSGTNFKGVDLSKAMYIYNVNLSQAKFDYPVYQQSLIGSVGRDIVYFPRQNIIFMGCFSGTLEEGIVWIDGAYPIDHPLNREYKAIIEHFKNLEKIRKGE